MSTDLEFAKEQLRAGDLTCAIYSDGNIFTSKDRGIKPLLECLDSGQSFRGASAADKVVGAGAAFLYVLLEVRDLYAAVISQRAAEILQAHGIRTEYGRLVAAIQNRSGTGICPMEEAVSGETDPREALKKLRRRVEELKARETLSEKK